MLMVLLLPILVLFFAFLFYYAEQTILTYQNGEWYYPDGKVSPFGELGTCMLFTLQLVTSIGFADTYPKTALGRTARSRAPSSTASTSASRPAPGSGASAGSAVAGCTTCPRGAFSQAAPFPTPTRTTTSLTARRTPRPRDPSRSGGTSSRSGPRAGASSPRPIRRSRPPTAFQIRRPATRCRQRPSTLRMAATAATAAIVDRR
ncbi:hypothetical protein CAUPRSCDRAFT_11662 [Caulochytrium protostelioides]|uniref:Ion transport domain-containing protein n=1 Tax=Caulochytrium protostelioides TaxID=1555241 RepID=A0A4P9WTQ4_9FUNG|nr:hypothetical protein CAUPRSCDRAFT_11662 [Caulochytrium protostelioides]